MLTPEQKFKAGIASASARKAYKAEVQRERRREDQRDMMMGLINAIYYGATSDLGMMAKVLLDRAEAGKGRASAAAEVESIRPGGTLALSKIRVSVEGENGEAEITKVKFRCDTIQAMHRNGSLDDTHVAAAAWFREMHERAGIGQIRSPDYEKPLVDGGGGKPDMSDMALDASVQLAKCRESIVAKTGSKGYEALEEIVGNGRTTDSLAPSFSRLTGHSARKHVTGTLIDALDELVEFRGMVARGKKTKKTVASHETVTGPSGTLTVNDNGSISMTYGQRNGG